MDNQHQKIKGYRELNQTEIALMNECKSLESQCAAMIKKLSDFGVAVPPLHSRPLDQRSIALAKTNLQQGFMWLVRGIAQPGGWE